MRYIEKTSLPESIRRELEDALKQNLSWEEFGNKSGDVKFQLRQFLMKEQQGLCAYSEVSLSEFGCHTEHIKPKGVPTYASLRFEYTNLLASAIESNLPVKADLFGGHKKGSRYDPTLFISPIDSTCSDFFQYSPAGDIEPNGNLSDAGTLKAEETIECLGLQSSVLLVNKRRSLYKTIQSQLAYVLDQPDAMREMLDYYFETDKEGNLKPFQSIVAQIART